MTVPINGPRHSGDNTAPQKSTEFDAEKYKKLIGTSTKESVWANYDSDAKLNGNNNGIFDESEVNRLIQDEWAKFEQGNMADETPAVPATPTDETPIETPKPEVVHDEEVKQEPPKSEEAPVEVKKQEEEKTTQYTVQSGETIEKIADKFKLTGEERKNFINHLKKQQGNRKWFQAGEKVNLPGEYQQEIQQMRSGGNYAEDDEAIQRQYNEIMETRRAERHRSETNVDEEGVVRSSHVTKPISKAQVQRTSTQQSSIPKAVLDKFNAIKKAGAGDKVQIKQNSDGTFSVIETDNKVGYMQRNKLKSIEFKYNKNGKYLCQYNTTQNGSVLQGTINPTTNKLEFKLYKNKEGTLQIIPDVVSKRAAEIKAQGGQVNIVKGKSTFTLVQTSGKYLSQHNIKKIEIKYTPDGKLIEQVTTRKNGEVDTTTFKNNKKVETVMTKKGSEYPEAVLAHYEKIKEVAKDDVKIVKNENGTFSIIETDNKMSYMAKNSLKSIEFVYNSEGKFLYQLNASNKDESVLKGVINPKTGKMEYTAYKNSQGILQQIPNKVFNKNIEIQQDGGTSKIYSGKNTFTIVQTGGRYLEENGISKIEHKYDPNGKRLQQVFTYKNGRVSTYYDSSTKGKDAAHNANPITIKLPDQYKGVDGADGKNQMIYGLNTNGPKDTAQRFSNSLAENKAHLMKTLHLTNEEYDNMAILAMGIAEQETHFGQQEYVDTKGNDGHSQDKLWNRSFRKKVANKYVWTNDEKKATHSQGITQIRYAKAINDPVVKKRFEENGIKSFQDFLSSPEKQAIATMILLNDCRKVAEGTTWQARLRANNTNVKNKKDRLTTNDITVLLWNGAGGVVSRMKQGEVIDINTTNKQVIQGTGVMAFTAKGDSYEKQETKTLKGMSYAKNIRAYSDKFFAEPEKGQAGASHMTSTAFQAGSLGATSQGNGGQLGEVVFMPRSYSNSGKTASTATQTKNAITYIDKNTQLSTASKELLKSYVKDGIIGFGKQGLTPEEAASINDNDVRLMQEQVEAVKLGKITPNQANTAFEEHYLRSREFTFKNNRLPQGSILRMTASSNPVNERIGGIEFTVDKAFYAGGKTPHSATYTSFNSSANSNVFGATRSQGVNPYLENGSKVDMKYQVSAAHAEHTATNVFESGGRCKTGISVDLEFGLGIDHRKIRGKGGKALPHAKMMTEFYENHPEVFSEIKYVDKGDGTSRELNTTDVHNLPCGYFGVFTPGKGYEKESGHAFVSDGFGGCFADEHDNGNWAHFGNGKGEHGSMRVYGLSNSVVPVKSEKLGRWVNVPLNINPWYLTPEFQELQKQERAKRGLPPLEPKEEFPI